MIQKIVGYSRLESQFNNLLKALKQLLIDHLILLNNKSSFFSTKWCQLHESNNTIVFCHKHKKASPKLKPLEINRVSDNKKIFGEGAQQKRIKFHTNYISASKCDYFR